MRPFLLLSLVSMLLAALLHAQPPRLDPLGDPLPLRALHRLGANRFANSSEIRALALSADGKLLATLDQAEVVALWDAATGKILRQWNALGADDMALSLDGKLVATRTAGFLRLWDASDGKDLRVVADDISDAFAFAPDGKAIVCNVQQKNELRLHDTATGRAVRSFDGLANTPTKIAFSLDGRWLAATDSDKDLEAAPEVCVWNAADGKLQGKIDPQAKRVGGLAFTPGADELLVFSSKGLHGWDAAKGKRLREIVQAPKRWMAVARNGVYVADLGLTLVDLKSNELTHELDPTLTPVLRLALSDNGTVLAAVYPGTDRNTARIRVWDLPAGKERTFGEGHQRPIELARFSYDGRTLVTGSDLEMTLRLWDSATGKSLGVVHVNSTEARDAGGPLQVRGLRNAVAFARDNKTIGAGGRLWELPSLKPLPSLPKDAPEEVVEKIEGGGPVALSPDGTLGVFFQGRNPPFVWNLAKGKAAGTFAIEDGRLVAPAVFSPDNRWLVFAGAQKRKVDEEDRDTDTLWLYDLTTNKLKSSFRPGKFYPAQFAFSPDSELLAAASAENHIEIWHVASASKRYELPDTLWKDEKQRAQIATLAFAPHGQLLATSAQPNKIHVWEIASGKRVGVLEGHAQRVTALAFSPDSRLLASGSRDATAIIWSLALPGDALKQWPDDDALWRDLAGEPTKAYQAVWALMAHPDRAVACLSKRLLAGSPTTDEEVAKLIADLSDQKFATRDSAMRKLRQLGATVTPALRQALDRELDLETNRRVKDLLRSAEAGSYPPEVLRELRALQVLEGAATPAARDLLARLAGTARGSIKARAAQGALERLR